LVSFQKTLFPYAQWFNPLRFITKVTHKRASVKAYFVLFAQIFARSCINLADMPPLPQPSPRLRPGGNLYDTCDIHIKRNTWQVCINQCNEQGAAGAAATQPGRKRKATPPSVAARTRAFWFSHFASAASRRLRRREFEE
ncbi:MAG TPA: hypothetical protein VHD63_21090, partial [Ktedonobacteraceae bacterium]|nr:hypothetical protein [Ktedonobacteraceae bacterium]